jgi:RanBP1 domain/Nucleoporin FG repeat region
VQSPSASVFDGPSPAASESVANPFASLIKKAETENAAILAADAAAEAKESKGVEKVSPSSYGSDDDARSSAHDGIQPAQKRKRGVFGNDDTTDGDRRSSNRQLSDQEESFFKPDEADFYREDELNGVNDSKASDPDYQPEQDDDHEDTDADDQGEDDVDTPAAVASSKSFFDRVTKDDRPFVPLAKTASASPEGDNTWKQGSPIKFGASTTNNFFGGSNTAGARPPTSTLFGGSTTSTPKPATSNLFGPNSASAKPASNIFGGMSSSTAKGAAGGIFGTSTKAAPAPSFSFGSAALKVPAPETKDESTTPAKAPSNIFGGLSSTPAKPPTGGLFGGSTPTAVKAPTSNFFGGSATPASAAPAVSIFGGVSTKAPALAFNKPPSVGFSFGNPAPAASSIASTAVTTAATTAESTPAPSDVDSGVEEAGPDGENHPQIVLKAGAGEEDEEILHEVRARVKEYNSETKDWGVRGTGYLKVLKNKSNQRVRVLLRADPSGVVLVNSPLIKMTQYTVQGPSTVKFMEPGSDGKLKYIVFIVKKGSESALSDVLEEQRKAMD